MTKKTGADDKAKQPAKQEVPPQVASQAAPQAGIQIITQYIKDVSFENPNAPESLVAGWAQPETNVHISLGHKRVKDNAYECLMHLRIEAKNKADQRTCFIVDLHYGALAVLQGIAPEHHQALLMVEVPKLLFPFAREIVAQMASAGGYPPLYLAPVNFEAIYVSELKKAQAGKAAAG